MKLNTLKAIVAIADNRSFSKAAKQLYISQSTLSLAVKEQEEELGIRLFERTNRGVSLTEDGEDFIRYARDIVAQAERLENRYQRKSPVPMKFSVTSQRLPFATKAFVNLSKELDIDEYDIAMRECPTFEVIHDVASERSPIGVMAIHDDHIDGLSSIFKRNHLHFSELDTLTAYVFIRKNHPLANKRSISSKDLEGYPFVTYDQEPSSSHYIEEVFSFESNAKNIHVNDRCSKLAFLRTTNCFSIGPDLPNSNGDAFHKGLGELRMIPLENEIGRIHAGYLLRENYAVTELDLKYIKHLISAIRELKSHE